MVNHKMNEEIIEYFIKELTKDWKSLREEFQPWGIWIKEYETITRNVRDGIDDTKTVVNKVWFLDKKGVVIKDVWEYRRMITVQFLQPWCKKTWKEPTLWATTKKHQIGFSSFAQYEQSNDYYFDTIYGGLFGRGCKVTFHSMSSISYENLWVS